MELISYLENSSLVSEIELKMTNRNTWKLFRFFAKEIKWNLLLMDNKRSGIETFLHVGKWY